MAAVAAAAAAEEVVVVVVIEDGWDEAGFVDPEREREREGGRRKRRGSCPDRIARRVLRLHIYNLHSNSLGVSYPSVSSVIEVM